MAETTTVLLILTVSAFVPPLIFLAWVRSTERYGREPWGRVLRTFLWGAVLAVILAVLLSLVLLTLFQEVDRVYVFSSRVANLEAIVLALLIAPLAEEFAKGLGVYFARPIIDEPEDGLIYGASSGLGFAATENLLYGILALVTFEQIGVSLLVIGVRSISSALLHASASATFGYGIGVNRLWPTAFRVYPYYLAAVAMHATFNFFASLGELSSPLLGEQAVLIGLGGAILLALIGFAAMRAKITREDARRLRW